MSERQPDFYWTKVDDEWEPAFHQGDGNWRIFGGWAEDDWFEEIGPRIPSPDEPWKTVPVEMIDDLKELAEDDPGFREHLGLDLYDRLANALKPGEGNDTTRPF